MPDPLVDAINARFQAVDRIVGGRIVRWIEESGLGLREVRVLLALGDHEGPAGARELSERSGLSIDAVYRALHSLHGRGLTSEEGRRHELADAGRETLVGFARAREAGVQDFVARLSADERRLIESSLGLT
jgi:DNA-binding MarR family transcriptional regulator